jgi:hypothetical protein
MQGRPYTELARRLGARIHALPNGDEVEELARQVLHALTGRSAESGASGSCLGTGAGYNPRSEWCAWAPWVQFFGPLPLTLVTEQVARAAKTRRINFSVLPSLLLSCTAGQSERRDSLEEMLFVLVDDALRHGVLKGDNFKVYDAFCLSRLSLMLCEKLGPSEHQSRLNLFSDYPSWFQRQAIPIFDTEVMHFQKNRI